MQNGGDAPKINENVLLKTLTNTNPMLVSTQDHRVETDQSFTKSAEYDNIQSMKIADAGSQCDEVAIQTQDNRDQNAKNAYGLDNQDEDHEEHYNFKSPIKIKMRSRSSLDFSTDHNP